MSTKQWRRQQSRGEGNGAVAKEADERTQVLHLHEDPAMYSAMAIQSWYDQKYHAGLVFWKKCVTPKSPAFSYQ